MSETDHGGPPGSSRRYFLLRACPSNQRSNFENHEVGINAINKTGIPARNHTYGVESLRDRINIKKNAVTNHDGTIQRQKPADPADD